MDAACIFSAPEFNEDFSFPDFTMAAPPFDDEDDDEDDDDEEDDENEDDLDAENEDANGITLAEATFLSEKSFSVGCAATFLGNGFFSFNFWEGTAGVVVVSSIKVTLNL